jgi:hypothetical protein
VLDVGREQGQSWSVTGIGSKARSNTAFWAARIFFDVRLNAGIGTYTTSAFMRVKLGRELTRTVRPHIFESKAEAQAFHSKV